MDSSTLPETLETGLQEHPGSDDNITVIVNRALYNLVRKNDRESINLILKIAESLCTDDQEEHRKLSFILSGIIRIMDKKNYTSLFYELLIRI